MARVKAEAVPGVRCVCEFGFSRGLSDRIFVSVKLTNHDPTGAILLSQPKHHLLREKESSKGWEWAHRVRRRI